MEGLMELLLKLLFGGKISDKFDEKIREKTNGRFSSLDELSQWVNSNKDKVNPELVDKVNDLVKKRDSFKLF